MTVVRFLGIPVAAFIELQAALDGLQREVHLSTFDGGAQAVDDDVVEGIVVFREAMDGIRTSLHEQTRAARAEGRAVADIEADYPDHEYDRIVAIMAASRRADEAARAGDLLTPPLAPHVRAVQEWMYHEVEVQMRGGAASAYSGPAGP